MPKVLKHKTKKDSDSSSQSPDAFPLSHISASSMRKFSSNPILFKIGYINRDVFETMQNASGVLGKAFHQAMEVYYGGSDTLIPTSESEAIEFGMRSGMDFLEKYNDGFINYSKTIPVKQKLFDLMTFCYQSYIEQTPYQADTVVAVEDEIVEEIDVEWRGQNVHLPVKLKGYIDKIERVDGLLKLKDYKTCYAYSNPEKIDGAKMLQAVEYYLLAYAKYGEEPYSITFEEIKYTKNSDGTPQVKRYEVVYAENELYFDFYFRFYEDMVRALNGEMVYVPNVDAMYDNEVAIISYIHRLDVSEETAKLMKKHKVDNVGDLLKKQIQSAGNMRKLLKTVEAKFVSAKNLDYSKMKNEQKIQTKMMEHGMMLQFDSKVEGASVDLYRYTPSIGLKMSRLANYAADVEQVLGVAGIRVLAPISGSTMVGFEVPRADRTFPGRPTASNGFDMAIGQMIDGTPRYFDIRRAPHMLVAGSSGSGKSVWLSGAIEQLSEISNGELYLFDPKIVELAQYEGIAKVYETDPRKINKALAVLVIEMNDRYKKMAAKKVRNIDAMKNIPYKFVVIDEFGDLILSEAVEKSVLQIAQKGRAAGIHLIIATQTPRADIISGAIKANFPIKILFKTAKAVDSRVVMDEAGAEKLLGRGDMLFVGDRGTERLQGYNLQ